jgi:hypothetical protein
MAMASYGAPVDLEDFRQHATPDGGFCTEPVAWTKFAPARRPGDGFDQSHADLAASVQAVGFDEPFPRAFREDADLALRTVRSGYGIAWGERVTTHPLTLSGSWRNGLKDQAGNADNALTRAWYGRPWRLLIGTTPGRTGRHLLTTAAALTAVVAVAAGRFSRAERPLGFARRHSADAAAAGQAMLVPTRDTKVDEIDSPHAIVDLISEVEARCFDAGLVLTSFHQSPLPLALLLWMAKVPWIGAICDDYPGSLLDLRHRVADGLPESERNLSLACAAGFVAEEKGARLAIGGPLPDVSALVGSEPYVVFHPGAAVPARRPTAAHGREIAAALLIAHDRSDL